MRIRSIISLSLVASATVLIAACGGGDSDGGKKISDVKTCLKDAGFKVTGPTKADKKDIEDAAFASYMSKDGDEMVFAAGGKAKTDDAVKDFQEKTKGGEDALKNIDDKFTFESGTDGRYVWAYGGTGDSDKVDEAKECVEA